MSKSIAEMTTTERVDWATGELTLAIGRGEFRSAVTKLMLAFMQAGYDKGIEDAAKRAQKEG